MELQAICKRIGTVATVFDDFDERPVDCDFMLPDYLPDITAVLKCMMKPVVQSHQISGDRVMADGTVYLQLLYLDEERRCVHSYEHTQPFTSSFTVKDLKSSDATRLSARANYINCRATGPRRVDVHGAFSVGLTVMTEGGSEAVTAVNCEGLFTRGCPVSTSVMAGQAEKTVSLNEVVDLGTAPAVVLLRNQAVATVTECRQMPEKAVIKGNVLLESVYVTDAQAGTVCRVSNSIPFSQILDVDGLTEEQLCDCRVQVVQCDARLMQDPGGENRLLSVAIKLAVTLECYRTETNDVLTDAYHTACSLKTEMGRLETCQIAFVRTDEMTVALSQELPDSDIAEIVDLWCEPAAATCRESSEVTVMSGELLICMIARDKDGVLSYYERTAEYEMELPETCEQMTAEVTPLETTYTQGVAQVELRVRMAVRRIGMRPQSQLVITQLEPDEGTPCVRDDLLDGCCLKVCFAAAGESVWELARRERTSPEALKAENGLTGEVLEKDTMLLIPMR